MRRRNMQFFKGRFFDYYMEERAAYPYDRWTWSWGMVVTRARGRQDYAKIGESEERPEPEKVFTNLINA